MKKSGYKITGVLIFVLSISFLIWYGVGLMNSAQYGFRPFGFSDFFGFVLFLLPVFIYILLGVYLFRLKKKNKLTNTANILTLIGSIVIAIAFLLEFTVGSTEFPVISFFFGVIPWAVLCVIAILLLIINRVRN